MTMQDTNIIVLTGNLGAAPTLRQTANGKDVGNLRLAVSRGKDGNSNDRGTDWFDVVVWNGTAKNCAQYLTVGAKILVEGTMRVREYEHEGQKRKAFELHAQRVQFLTPKAGQPEGASTEVPPPEDEDIPF